jgi:hypothetical protein
MTSLFNHFAKKVRGEIPANTPAPAPTVGDKAFIAFVVGAAVLIALFIMPLFYIL